MEIVHSMSNLETDCPKCNSENTLKKELSIPRVRTSDAPRKVGGVVKQTISEYKERVATERGVWENFDVDEMLKESKK